MARRKAKTGRWVLVLPGWRPPSTNSVMGRCWQAAHRAKKRMAKLLGDCARLARVPPAAGRRRLSAVVTLGPRQKRMDPDNVCKLLFDSCKRAGIIRDDSERWLEWGGLVYSPVRGARPETLLVIEEVDGG
jgi:hypothetical protein